MTSSNVPKLDKFMFGLSIRTGALVIGWIQMTALFFLLTRKSVDLYDSLDSNEPISNYVGYYKIQNQSLVEDAVKLGKWYKMTDSILSLSLGGFCSIIVLTMIIGVLHKKHNLFSLWLLAKSVAIGLLLFTTFVEAWNFGVHKYVFHRFVYLGLSYYAYLVVYNCYREIKIENESNQDITTLTGGNAMCDHKPAQNKKVVEA